MNPSVKDRLASVVRALNGVVLPALPKDAGLAQEQVMLAMGHIQIILAQMDAAPGFLADEAHDVSEMGRAVADAATGGAATQAANMALEKTLSIEGSAPEVQTAQIQDAIDAVLTALKIDGDPASYAVVKTLILTQGAVRADKDRRWFAAMGFDIDYSGG
jgi:hypothetical protein